MPRIASHEAAVAAAGRVVATKAEARMIALEDELNAHASSLEARLPTSIQTFEANIDLYAKAFK